MMELWNDFEGKTIDGRFPLEHLIGPKGRSAYFTGKTETGTPVVVRLIESLNDEEEILSRWRTVTGMKQEHLVEVMASGQTVLDGTHLVYAVMEPTDAELADVLRERALTSDETRQIALSVADGLQSLHDRGLVHEHVEAENVLAKGETVKLRSDVVREAPEGAEGAALRARDVRDLSLLLRQALTRSRTTGQGRLPSPFEEVIGKGESGAWGLKEIIAALRPGAVMARPMVPVAPVTPSVRPVEPVKPGPVPAKDGPATVNPPSAVVETAVPTAPATVASRLRNQSSARGDEVTAHLRSPRSPDRIVMPAEAEPKRSGLLAGIAAGVLLLVLLGIYFLRAGRAGQSRSAVQDTPSAATVPQQSGENRPPAHDAASAPVPQPSEKPSAALGSSQARDLRAGRAAATQGAQWRVVAFTYNREEQAAQKAHAIATQHPALKPEVFSPNGRAPYLVTLGGWMSVEEASALRNKARAQGLPRDMYKQNYRGSGR